MGIEALDALGARDDRDLVDPCQSRSALLSMQAVIPDDDSIGKSLSVPRQMSQASLCPRLCK